MNEVPISLLKPHPKNADYYDDLPDEKYREVKRSIEAQGIRDPLKVTPDYTVIAGHQRLKIAKELGLEKVPVVILDVTPEEAEYLLIADNEERRQGDSDNPMKKAKRADFLKRYWGVREGSANPKGTVVPRQGKNYPDNKKTLDDVAEAIGETRENLKKLLKLNDLIPNLQTLVANGKLTQTAAHSLAFLPPEEQEHLLKTLSESGICGLSVREAQELRRELDSARKEKDALANRLAEIEEEKASLFKQLADIQVALFSVEEEIAEKLGQQYEEKLREAVSGLQRKLQKRDEELEQLRARLKELKPVEKVVEKVVYKTDPAAEAELEAARKQAAELLKEKEWLRSRVEAVALEKEKKEARLRALEDEAERLRRMLDHAHKELEKEKSRPRPPQRSKEHLEFRTLMEEASRSAASLATALSQIEEKHAKRLLAAARIRGVSDLNEMAEAVGDALLYQSFDAGLNAVAGRIGRIWDLLEPGKPRLQLVKNKAKGGEQG